MTRAEASAFRGLALMVRGSFSGCGGCDNCLGKGATPHKTGIDRDSMEADDLDVPRGGIPWAIQSVFLPFYSS